MLREMAENKTKCQLILKELCGKKLYIEKENIGEVRKYFKARTNMLPFAGNYPGDRRFASTCWLCMCGSREQKEHIRGGEYPVYSDIRREYDNLEEDEELVSFLTRVLDRRDHLDLLDMEEEELEEQRSAEEHSAPRWAATPPPVYLPAPAGQYSDACRVYWDTLWNIP